MTSHICPSDGKASFIAMFSVLSRWESHMHGTPCSRRTTGLPMRLQCNPEDYNSPPCFQLYWAGPWKAGPILKSDMFVESD